MPNVMNHEAQLQKQKGSESKSASSKGKAGEVDHVVLLKDIHLNTIYSVYLIR
jgi:hypothetical protein